METSVHVGIAGFGKMGSAMAARLAETGAQVLVWNRDPDAPRKAGFEVAETARDLARRCEIVISSLFDDAALKAVFEGVDGLIAGGAGRLFIEMSTVLPRAPSRAAEFQGLARDQSPAHPARRAGRVTAGGGGYRELRGSGVVASFTRCRIALHSFFAFCGHRVLALSWMAWAWSRFIVTFK